MKNLLTFFDIFSTYSKGEFEYVESNNKSVKFNFVSKNSISISIKHFFKRIKYDDTNIIKIIDIFYENIFHFSLKNNWFAFYVDVSEFSLEKQDNIYLCIWEILWYCNNTLEDYKTDDNFVKFYYFGIFVWYNWEYNFKIYEKIYSGKSNFKFILQKDFLWRNKQYYKLMPRRKVKNQFFVFQWIEFSVNEIKYFTYELGKCEKYFAISKFNKLK